MDEMDGRILALLKENGRISSSEISKRVSLSIAAVGERIRKLEDTGVIEQYTIKINREKTGGRLLAFVMVNLEKPEDIEPFREEIVKCTQVLECHHVVGRYDYILKILVRDTVELESFLSGVLKKNYNIKANAIISLSTLKETLNW